MVNKDSVPLTPQQATAVSYGLENEKRVHVPLPFYRYFHLPKSSLPTMPMDNQILMELCAPKILFGGAIGSILGIGMGVFMGMMNDPSPHKIVNGREVPMAPMREFTTPPDAMPTSAHAPQSTLTALPPCDRRPNASASRHALAAA